MIDIRSFIKALKCAWNKKYLDENNTGKCPFFPNLNIKDVKEISRSFTKKMGKSSCEMGKSY